MEGTVARCVKKIHKIVYDTNDSNQIIRAKIMAMPKKLMGCIGRCSPGLTVRELDIITDHIHKTLSHCKGRRIFREFLHEGNRIDDLACLKFYEKICQYIDDDENYLRSTTEPNLTQLTSNLDEALDIAADLNGIPEIDMALLKKYSECLRNPCRESMLNVLGETKYLLACHLENAHKDFRSHLLKSGLKSQ